MTLFLPLVVPPPAALPTPPPAVVWNIPATPDSDRPEAPTRSATGKVASRVGRNSPLDLSIKRAGFLFAQTHKDANGLVGLSVYRSVAVQDSDPIYAPVTDVIADHKFQLAYSAQVADASMMFGKAEDSYYVTVDTEKT
ncbi:hypothetical protein KIY76_gp68 [Mycobacterium phage Miramae]|uniref:Uncharacterized protein n=1 Tax=Mycobacterium phage Miramae TaxID=2517961 RepID=A0A482JCU8_9CAUD|nr:hypothetical protein KIY76_gp68 [Mycobacterium phage Miramae]QBP31453.1 hypothetical protein SEA_MIRAMAE_68 [Mycobacterium phage Miramae]